MSRPSTALTRSAISRHPSPTTLAAANAQQAADAMPRETALQDGVLLVLSYEGDNIFVLSNSSYEHVLDSALANFGGLRRADRSHLRLALQTTIGSNATLVYITPDTWPAVASRAKVVTILFQRPSPTLSHSSPNPPAKLPPPTHRVASPVRESETASWTGSPPTSHQGTSWHSAYPPASATYSTPSAQPAPSPPKGTTRRTHSHSRQHSQPGAESSASAHYPYAHMHYLPASSAVSPTTDLSSIGVRLLTDTELRQERPSGHHTASAKRHWDQRDDAGSDERASYTRPAPEIPAGPQVDNTRSRDFGGPSQHDEARKAKRARTWNPPDHQYSCRRCHRTDSPAWRKGPDGPKTLCNACGLSYAKELARREAASSAVTQQQAIPSPPEQPAGYGYPSAAATHTPASRSARVAGLKTLDGSETTLLTPEGSFSAPSGSTAPSASIAQPLRECSVCKRTDSPQWRKGPNGPNTLCNSCGLAWARTQRKSEGAHSRPSSSRSQSPTSIPPTYHQAAPLPRSPNGHMRSPSAGSHLADSPNNAGSPPEAP